MEPSHHCNARVHSSQQSRESERSKISRQEQDGGEGLAVTISSVFIAVSYTVFGTVVCVLQ